MRIYPRNLKLGLRDSYSGSNRLELAKQLIYKSFENALGITPDALMNSSRKHEIVRCRIIVSYIGKNLLKLNWRQCGVILNRDHSTVIHNHNSHVPCYDQDYKDYQRYYQAILGELLNLVMVQQIPLPLDD